MVGMLHGVSPNGFSKILWPDSLIGPFLHPEFQMTGSEQARCFDTAFTHRPVVRLPADFLPSSSFSLEPWLRNRHETENSNPLTPAIPLEPSHDLPSSATHWRLIPKGN